MSDQVRHPIFARLYARLSPGVDARGAADHRRETLAGLSGRVVELGAGNGLNFAYYPATVSEVVAGEPEDYLRRRAQQAASRAPLAVSVVDAVADRLPFADETFDAAVASLVLCSVPDQARALAELGRVLRPGGELRFYEHVRPNNVRTAAIWQRADDWNIYPRIAGGCHAARDTKSAIAAAGFTIEDCRRFPFKVPSRSRTSSASHADQSCSAMPHSLELDERSPPLQLTKQLLQEQWRALGHLAVELLDVGHGHPDAAV